MSIDKARKYLRAYGCEDKIKEFSSSSATVALAALAVGCSEGEIAKTLSFDIDGRTALIVAAGDMKIDNSKYKARFGKKAKMLTHDEVLPRIGHDIGGVCPFGVNESVEVYLDESLKRFETVYPAAGSSNSAAAFSPDELYSVSRALDWVSVCKPMVE